MYKDFSNLKKKEKQEFNKIAVRIFKKFNAIESEFGGAPTRFAMRRYLTQFSEQNKRKVEIAKLERELEQLKRKELR